MPSDTKVSRLILQLTKATVDKEIKWDPSDAPRSLTRGNNDVISFFITANYKGRQLALFERRYQSYDGEHDSLYWLGDDVLAILDYNNEVIWEHRENSSALTNLVQVARESAGNVDDLLDSLLE